MAWTPLLIVVLVGFASAVGDGAWKPNRLYTYKLTASTFIKSSELNDKWIGTVYRTELSIRPKSRNQLIGQFNQFEYADVKDVQSVEMIDSRSSEQDVEYNRKPSMNKPFEIRLDNDGVIRSLLVDRSMTDNESKLMKILLSSLQVNTQDKNNKFASAENDNDALYTVMEPIATGNCETIYDISTVPEYLLKSKPELAPLSTFDDKDELIKIIKTRNNKKCTEYPVTSRRQADDDTTFNPNPNYEQDEEVSQIIISGSLNTYTIQSSVSTQNITAKDNGSFYKNVNLTLQSVEEVLSSRGAQDFDNLMDVGSLIYSQDAPIDLYRTTSALKAGVSDAEVKFTSGCYTKFVSGRDACKNEFSPEYESVDKESCGFLYLGTRYKCRKSFPGCVASACFSGMVNPATWCRKQFGNAYPYERGTFGDCFSTFYRNRCCPSSN